MDGVETMKEVGKGRKDGKSPFRFFVEEKSELGGGNVP